MSGLFGLGRKKHDDVDQTTGTGTGTGTGSGTGLGSGNNTGVGSTSQRGTGSDEARNLHYEGTTASGARSGRTGATSQLDSGAGTGTGTGNRSGMTGTGTGAGMTGTTGTSGISEGFRGMNLTHQSGYDANHPVVGNSSIVCDTKYYTAVEDRPIIKEIKTYIREHHPIEKEFVVETRPTGQEREQTQHRSSEVVNTRETIVETTPADPCGGVPTSQYNSGTTGTGNTGSHGTTTGAGYGSSTGTTGAGYGSSTGTGVGSGSTGQGTGAGGRTIT